MLRFFFAHTIKNTISILPTRIGLAQVIVIKIFYFFCNHNFSFLLNLKITIFKTKLACYKYATFITFIISATRNHACFSIIFLRLDFDFIFPPASYCALHHILYIDHTYQLSLSYRTYELDTSHVLLTYNGLYHQA